ncbi:MAG: PhoH family protein [Clostridia bacterium]|nr:PhoH family protein [Clostridia bacterium]
MIKRIVKTNSSEDTSKIFGSYDKNLKRLEAEFGVKISNKSSEGAFGDSIVIDGDDRGCEDAYNCIVYLRKIATLNDDVTDQNVEYAVNMVRDGRFDELSGFGEDCLCVTSKGKPIRAKTVGQKRYADAIKKNTVVLGVGPAGTGKTYLAVTMAVKALRAHEVSRIILTRPAVEAGERLGFLPGDLQSKIDPYLRPLYDALYDMLGFETCQKLMERAVIEIAPLAYMRGRTLDDSFIILDEAQNTTREQMKMFLTRLGNGSKAVVTGDLTQTDLPGGEKSGLAQAVKILKGIDDIAVFELTERDVVRHRLVQKIIAAYEKHSSSDKRISRTSGTRKSKEGEQK